MRLAPFRWLSDWAQRRWPPAPPRLVLYCWPDGDAPDWRDTEPLLPALDSARLEAIDRLSQDARPLLLLRWIQLIDDSAGAPDAETRAHAQALRHKLEHLLAQWHTRRR